MDSPGQQVLLSNGAVAVVHAKPPESIRVDLTGKHFGRLIVLGFADRARLTTYWLARCVCGSLYCYEHGNLQSGASTQCRKCHSSLRPPCRRTHGMSDTLEYGTWQGMINRCCNENTQGYARYGGRGIKICDRWRQSFQAFYDDMGPKPSAAHSIDRIDNDGDYRPDNCRWATPKEQVLNSSVPCFLEHNGEYLCISDWAHRIGISREAMRQRVRKYPLPVALAVPHGSSCKAAARLLLDTGGADC